eukprot:m.36356 g.36356  ORF g.36356 m.36356 type:complete len:236 (+) comp9988_c0_seq3:146-853(+)
MVQPLISSPHLHHLPLFFILQLPSKQHLLGSTNSRRIALHHHHHCYCNYNYNCCHHHHRRRQFRRRPAVSCDVHLSIHRYLQFLLIRSVWVARNPPGFAFVTFDDRHDANDAVRDLDGQTIGSRPIRVQLARSGGPRSRGDRGDRGDRRDRYDDRRSDRYDDRRDRRDDYGRDRRDDYGRDRKDDSGRDRRDDYDDDRSRGRSSREDRSPRRSPAREDRGSRDRDRPADYSPSRD